MTWQARFAECDLLIHARAMQGRMIRHDATSACRPYRHRPASEPTTTSLSGENDMRHWLIGLMLLVAPSAFAQQAVPIIAFDSVPNPLKLPNNMYFGEVSG